MASVPKKRSNAVHHSKDNMSDSQTLQEEAVPEVVPVDDDEEEEDSCFCAGILQYFKSWWNNPALTNAYFEAQRPGYSERPCTDTLPQKPSANNPRHRSQWYRNR